MRLAGVSIRDLMKRMPQAGQVKQIMIRPERRQPPQLLASVYANAEFGLEGDHYGGGTNGKRQVTLINEEHIQAMASFVGLETLDPTLLRRNLVIQGINLLALKDREFRVGKAILKMTGQCHPCSRMEENLGTGGYNAVRGHGGITATIVHSGMICQGDTVELIE